MLWVVRHQSWSHWTWPVNQNYIATIYFKLQNYLELHTLVPNLKVIYSYSCCHASLHLHVSPFSLPMENLFFCTRSSPGCVCTRFLSLILANSTTDFRHISLLSILSKLSGWECHFYSLISNHLLSSYLVLSHYQWWGFKSQKSITLVLLHVDTDHQWFKLLENGL